MFNFAPIELQEGPFLKGYCKKPTAGIISIDQSEKLKKNLTESSLLLCKRAFFQ